MPGPKPDSGYQAFPGGQASSTPETSSGNDYMNPQATPNAFGAQIGEATEKFGDTLGQTVQKFSDIYNDSTARDGVTEASKQLADLENEFKQNKGNNAVSAYKDFQQRAGALQDTMASSMPTIGAQKMFKDQFAKEVNGAIFRSGAYVADQAEAAQTKSMNDSIANNVNQFAMNADNPTRATYLNNIQGTALQLAHTQGLSEESADKMVSHNVGEAYYNAIRNNITQNPDLAKKLYDEGTNGSFTANRVDAQGNKVQVSIPYLDDSHRAQVTNEMQGEFRRQEGEALQTARSWASSGENYDAPALESAMKNAGRSQDYIDAQMSHLNNVKQQFGVVENRYSLGRTLDNDEALAFSGKPVQGTYDPATVTAAYPKNPEKVQEVLNQVDDLHKVAGFVGGFSTRTPTQIMQDLQAFKPVDSKSFDPLAFTVTHEGGYVSNDSGKGPSNFGVNKEANPDVDVSSLTPDAAKGILKSRYFDKVVTSDMSPQMQMAAGDTAVNMGVSKAKDLIEQSDNDPSTLIQLRRQEYQRLATANPEKYGASLDGWNKRLDDLQASVGGVPAGGDNYSDQQNLYEKLQKATATYFKKLDDDPAGTVTDTDPILTTLFNNATKDPTQWGAYIDASLSRQEAVGVPEASRSGLPSAAATTLANGIMQNPVTAPDTLSKLEEQSGSHWPAIYHSLVTQGGLSPGYQAVVNLNSSSDTKQDAYTLARWFGEDRKGKSDADLIGGAKVETDIKNNINGNTAVNDLKTSLIASGQTRDQVEGTMNAVYSLAYAKSFYNHDPNAAQNAADSFTSRYNFMTAGNARVPAASFPAVKLNADNVLHNISQMAVPADIYSDNVHGTVTKPENYFAWVQNSPTWVTNPTEDALWLKDPQDRWVRGKDGKPLSVAFNQPAPAAAPQSAPLAGRKIMGGQ